MPWIGIARQPDGRLTPTGDMSCSLGHRISRADRDDDGVYAGWEWDGPTGTLRTENDRYGFYPLFVWIAGEKCLVTSEIHVALKAAAPVGLDYDALAVFLRVGFFLGDDTPFRGIRALPPRARMSWAKQGAVVDGMWPKATASSRLSRAAAVDAFIEAVRGAVRRRPPDGPYHLPLSGGRDSRHLLLALVEAGHAPEACVTVEHFPPRANDDATVAAQICQRLGIRHVRLSQRAARLRVEREKNLRTQLCTDEHAQFIVLADYLRRSTRCTYDGIAGDVLSQSSYLTREICHLFERADDDAIAGYVLDGYGTMVSEAALARLLPSTTLREVPRERAVARLAGEIRRHREAANPVASFFFWNRTRREIALSPYGVMRDVTVYAPYLDRDVFDLLTSLPAALMLDRGLHTDAIAKAFPQHAQVPYAVASPPRVRRARSARRLAVDLLRVVMSAPGVLRRDTLLPGLLAAAIDGRAERLWYTALACYLADVGRVASRRA